jgi:hypothetical protein
MVPHSPNGAYSDGGSQVCGRKANASFAVAGDWTIMASGALC